eukprot:6115783-Pleurochrysis_carterae.AAC.1
MVSSGRWFGALRGVHPTAGLGPTTPRRRDVAARHHPRLYADAVRIFRSHEARREIVPAEARMR